MSINDYYEKLGRYLKENPEIGHLPAGIFVAENHKEEIILLNDFKPTTGLFDLKEGYFKHQYSSEIQNNENFIVCLNS
jgi:hypothetical protein